MEKQESFRSLQAAEALLLLHKVEHGVATRGCTVPLTSGDTRGRRLYGLLTS